MAGHVLADQLPANTPTSQRAWLTDSDDNIIVQHIVRLEDEVYARYASVSGLRSLLCNSSNTMDSSGTETMHVIPEQALIAPGDANKSIAPHHLEPLYYYTRATCEVVSRRFALDFRSFGYDTSVCMS